MFSDTYRRLLQWHREAPPVLGERNGKSGGAGERGKSLKYRRLGTPGPAAFHLYQHTPPDLTPPESPKGR